MAPSYGWGSTASRLQPFRGGSLLFTIQFPEIPGTHFIDLGRMKGVEPTKSAQETIQQLPNTVPLIASLKIKTEEPASTFSALTNIAIRIPEQRRSNPKHNGKKNFVLDELVFSSSDSSSENVSEEEPVAWYCGKCYKETPPGHLKVNYNNWIECNICKQCYHPICENVDPDSYINREFKCSNCK